MSTIASRVATRLTALFAVVTGLVALPAGIALASVPAPDPNTFSGASTTDLPTSTVNTVTSTGMSGWAIVAIAFAAVVVGIALTEAVHRFGRRNTLATA